MKKLFVAIWFFLIMTSCNAHDLYEVDPVATANAPWKVGEIIGEMPKFSFRDFKEKLYYPAYRVFLGVNKDGYYIVQHFYRDGDKKASAPFLIIDDEAVTTGKRLQHGEYISWYPNGQKLRECYFDHGSTVKPCIGWYENGQIRIQESYKNGLEDGEYIYWYPNGQKFIHNIIEDEKVVDFIGAWDEDGKDLLDVPVLEQKAQESQAIMR